MQPLMVYSWSDEDGWQELADVARVAFGEHHRPVETGHDRIRRALTDVGYAIEDLEPALVWPRQYGKKAFTLTATFSPSRGIRDLFAWVDEHVRTRQAVTVDRLAHELGITTDAARRHFDAVQDVLYAAGLVDGYGGLTVPQPVRAPVPWPDR